VSLAAADCCFASRSQTALMPPSLPSVSACHFSETLFSMGKHIVQMLTLVSLLPFAAQAQSTGCNASADSPSVTIALPSRPFTAVPSHDGCWVFVSLTGPKSGIGVLKRGGGTLELLRVAPLASAPTGIALTHDGKLLIAAASDIVIFLDVQRLISGAADPVLGSFSDGPNSESIYANVTADDKLLFVSEEAAQSITVIDLERARANGYKAEAIKGKIPTGLAPIALTFSPDGKWLYTTSQLAARPWNWPAACKPEGSPAGSPIVNPEGAVIVVDAVLAATDPAKSVVARIPAGCSPVRTAISPVGDRLYVTARNSNAVVAFDTARLLTDADHARLGMALVGSAPVPVAVVDGGRKVLAGNSNRFGGTTSGESLTVLDATKIKGDADAGMGVIPAGSFPREMRVSDDGHTLFLTNFGSNSLQVMSVDHLMDAAGPAQAQKSAPTPPMMAQNPAPPAPAQAPKAAAGDAATADLAVAAEDIKNASVASEFVSQLSGVGDVGASRLEASRAAMTADTAAAAAETAAAAVESDAAKAMAASAAGDRPAMNNARDKAASDYSALLAADGELVTAAIDLAAAAAGNVAFYAANAGAAAINEIRAQDAAAAANLLSAVTKSGTAAYTVAAANEATAITNANAIADLAPTRAPAFRSAAKAEAEARSAATAAAAGGSASAAASALAAAATAGATADGPGNPYAGAVDIGAAAVANAVSATISAQQAMARLKR
jgi:DNA-binding beta-propeller fold protein YncE